VHIVAQLRKRVCELRHAALKFYTKDSLLDEDLARGIAVLAMETLAPTSNIPLLAATRIDHSTAEPVAGRTLEIDRLLAHTTCSNVNQIRTGPSLR